MHSNSSFADRRHSGVDVAPQLLHMGFPPLPSLLVAAAVGFFGLGGGGCAETISLAGVIVVVGVVTDEDDADGGGVCTVIVVCECCSACISAVLGG